MQDPDLALVGKVDSPSIWYDLGSKVIVVDGQMKVETGGSGKGTIVSIPDLYLRWNRTSLSKSPRRRRSAARRPNARLYLIPRGEHDLARVYAESVAPLIAPESADHRLDTSKTRMKSPHVAIKTDTAVAHWGPCLAWIDIDLAALQ